jgi:hypothetical protein
MDHTAASEEFKGRCAAYIATFVAVGGNGWIYQIPRDDANAVLSIVTQALKDHPEVDSMV